MSARVTIKVHPRAKRTGCAGKLGEAYKIDVAAPADGGRANEACVAFLAERLGVARGSIRIRAGASSRLKVIEIEGITQAGAEGKLSV